MNLLEDECGEYIKISEMRKQRDDWMRMDPILLPIEKLENFKDKIGEIIQRCRERKGK